MWVIESPGNIFNGSRKWLRPGKTYKIGRAKTGVDFFIEGKSISRIHCEIRVGSVEYKGALHVSSRSSINIVDLDTKFGTFVNSERVQNNYSIVGRIDEIEIYFGKIKSDHTTLLIKWVPVVITFSTGEETLIHRTIEKKLIDQLEPLDIKLLSEFHPSTTHFLKGTKNSSKLLYALVNGIPIVSMEYPIALQRAANDLESNYDEFFPNPSKFLPDPVYDIETGRKTCFSGMTFIFGEQKQRDALLAVIASAGGKALLIEVSSSSSAQKIADHIRQTGGKSPVVVKYPVSSLDPDPQSLQNLLIMNEAAKLVGVHLTDATEFLNAIKSSDGSILNKPRKSGQATSEVSIMAQSINQPKSESGTPLGIKARQRARGMAQPMNILDLLSAEADISLQTPNAMEKTRTQASTSQSSSEIASISKRKRVIPSRHIKKFTSTLLGTVEDEDSQELDVAPTARELKRQRLDHDLAQPIVEETEITVESPVNLEEKRDSVRLMDVIRENRKRQEDLLDDINRPSTLNEGVDIPNLCNLAIVEASMPVLNRHNEANKIDENVQWTGVPNFKIFRKSKVSNLALKTTQGYIQLVDANMHSRSDREVNWFENSGNETAEMDTGIAGQHARKEESGLFVDSSSDIETTNGNDRSMTGTVSAVRSSENSGHEGEGDDDDDDDDFRFRFTS